jgi:hypothetical protein
MCKRSVKRLNFNVRVSQTTGTVSSGTIGVRDWGNGVHFDVKAGTAFFVLMGSKNIIHFPLTAAVG